jgi:hypothetical protein
MNTTASKPSKSEMDYRAEDDFRTLQRGEEVRMDTARHQRALGHGRKQMTAMAKVVGRSKKIGMSGRVAKRAPARR